jgi:hypothetical protein
MNDENKKRILARRAKFLVAAAAATVTTACASKSEACLSFAEPDTGADTRPQACLVPEPEDSSSRDTAVQDTTVTDSSADTTTTDTAADTADTFPMPCLVPPLDTGGE